MIRLFSLILDRILDNVIGRELTYLNYIKLIGHFLNDTFGVNTWTLATARLNEIVVI